MPAYTAHLDLYLPGGGSLSIGGDDEAIDIDKINQNMQKVDEWAILVDADRTKLTQGNGWQASRNANFNTTTSEVPIAWTADDYSDGDWTRAGGTLTCARAGVYYVNCQFGLLAGVATTTTLSLRKGGAAFSQGRTTRNPSGDSSHSVSGLVQFAVGDTLTATLVSTAATTIDCTANRTLISIFRVKSI